MRTPVRWLDDTYIYIFFFYIYICVCVCVCVCCVVLRDVSNYSICDVYTWYVTTVRTGVLRMVDVRIVGGE